MIKVGLRLIIALVVVALFSTCIDPYVPKLKSYEALLVVDGLVTNTNSSYSVRLSRSFQYQNSVPSLVNDATVSITDDIGNIFNLNNKGNGIYKTDSTQFQGAVGRTYVLHIQDKSGDMYESDVCQMQPVSDIDSIYFAADQQLYSNGTINETGVSIYLDSKELQNNQCLRWSFNETWKFRVPDPKKFDYINDTTIVPVANVKEYCWKNNKSDGILIYTQETGTPGYVMKQPINFIATGKSDRLLVQYSILVSQYSISKKEYDFWNNLKQVNENGGDIFAAQPFSVTSNVHNINNPAERVLGYFQVSAVKQKRKYITFSDFARLNLPYYHYVCERIEKSPDDFPIGWGAPPVTWGWIDSVYTLKSNYAFIEPQYIPGTMTLEKLIFSTKTCADCELSGSSVKPDFWTDLN